MKEKLLQQLNKERLYALADAVELETKGNYYDDEPGFDMHVWSEDILERSKDGSRKVPYKSCGTCRCIGGVADAIYGDHDRTLANDGEVTMEFRVALDELFFPEPYIFGDNDPRNPYNATPAQAAAVIRHFADTGVVDWARVMQAGTEVGI